MVPGDGIEPPTCGFSGRAPEFHNFLGFRKLLRDYVLALAGALRIFLSFARFGQVSHTESHTARPPPLHRPPPQAGAASVKPGSQNPTESGCSLRAVD